MAFAIGYVHPGKVHHGFMESVMSSLVTFGEDVVIIPRQAGPNLARFRNDVVKKFLAIEGPKMDGLLFVDTDIVFGTAQVDEIRHSDYDITSGLYWNPRGNEKFPVFTWGPHYDIGTRHRVKQAHRQPFEVSGVGMGFCYIKRYVLKKLDVGPLWPFGEMTHGDVELGEDVTFSMRARRNGFTCWLDPAIEVRHIKEHLL